MANQKFPEVGLRAVFELTGFMTGFRSYQTMMRDIDRTAKGTAQKVTKAGQEMGTGFATTFGDLASQSKELDGLSKAISRFSELSKTSQAAMDKWGSSVRDFQSDWQAASDAFAGLGKKAQVNVDTFDRLTEAGVNYGDAMRAAGGQIQVDLALFDQLIQKGKGADEAFRQASSGATGASGSISILGHSFSIMAVAVGAATLALKTGIGLIRESISTYEELGEATRRVSYQTGLLTREASNWVIVAEAAGISTATSERAMTAFLGKVADLRREQVAGEESTSEFAKAIDTLGINITNADGSLRSADELLNDINGAFRQLGPGVVSAQLATDLFGYSGRTLLPILVDQEQSLSDLGDQAEKFGATMTSLDREVYEKLRQSNTELKQSWEGVKLTMGRGWVEAKTSFNTFIADILNGIRQVDAAMRAFSKTVNDFPTLLQNAINPLEYLSEQFRYFMGLENEAARAAEETAQAQANAAQDTVVSVREIREEWKKTLEQLDELKDKLAEKLDKINQDAARQWEDILVKRQRDAMDRALQLAWRLDDLRTAYNERLDNIERDFAKRWDDILVQRQRDAMERAMRLAWRYEDLARNTERSRQDVLRDFAERESKLRQDTRKRIEEAEQDAREKRENLEREHQKRLAKIQQSYLDTVNEAARQNDAVAVARAMRQRDRELRDEQTRYVEEQRDLEESLAKKRQQIEEDRYQREEDHRRELERALQRINENHQRQLEEIARQTERERILREQQEAWELEDFNKAKAAQQQAAKEWYEKQLADLEQQQEREAILRAIQYEREEIDFVKNWQRRIEDAQEWYQKERDALAEHLKMTGEQLEQAYELWAKGAAAAASRVVAEITNAFVSEIIRYQQVLSESQRIYAKTAGLGVAGGMRTPAQTPRIPGAPMLAAAEGGVVHATSPTHILMGEGGPETGVFLPGSMSSLNVNHSFGRLGVDFEGLPGGMNTQQVQAIVYAVVTQLAKGVQLPRS